MSRFSRPQNVRTPKKLFIIVCEGKNTEPQYFEKCFSGENFSVRIPSHGNKSAPNHLLKVVKEELRKNDLKKGVEAWCVCDTDKWTPEQLRGLLKWSKKKTNYGLAVSNPNFEFWLLLHFEDGNKVRNSVTCKTRLEQHLPGYDKNIDSKKFTKEKIEKAVERAKIRDNPPCESLPCEKQTTVYRLVERILAVA